ncbi:DNA repair RAD50 [Gossypium australe]|uniref:DNA repair RAD50 n=1 Tax=Gossypium australe TaxID=47621 RepID=A0A5B6VZQ2_9ROSI|nr:DNA repair RAD50 [Gossypium australe]
MEIQHPIHYHPLSIIENPRISRYMYCSECKDPLRRTTIYGCIKCLFYVHKSCLDRFKPEVQSFFHPCPLVLSSKSFGTCSACFGEISSNCSYQCKLRCLFSMHVECALKPMVEYSDEEQTIQHFTHFHPLKPVVDSTLQKQEVVCAICEKLCSSSSSTYGCTECKFFLHKSCMTNIPRQLINHLIHPCTLLFHTTRFSRCDKCGEDIISRIEFRCQRCYFHLHVKCSLLPTVDSEDAKEIQHFSHPHPLALIENHKDFNNEPRCVVCVETCLSPTPAFRCSRRSCNHFFLHKSCALKLPYLPPHIYHPSDPHKLTITSLPYNDEIHTCGACYRGFDSCLIAYSCPENRCGFNLHLDCSKLEPSFALYGHDHLLTLFEKVAGMTCHFCGANCCNFILRCLECHINIHIQCHPSAPKTINHKSHLHPLRLTKSPLEYELNSEEEGYNSEDEFYCDVCEQKRNKRELIYFCAECRFIAEVKCVISAVRKF